MIWFIVIIHCWLDQEDLFCEGEDTMRLRLNVVRIHRRQSLLLLQILFGSTCYYMTPLLEKIPDVDPCMPHLKNIGLIFARIWDPSLVF